MRRVQGHEIGRGRKEGGGRGEGGRGKGGGENAQCHFPFWDDDPWCPNLQPPPCLLPLWVQCFPKGDTISIKIIVYAWTHFFFGIFLLSFRSLGLKLLNISPR